MILVDTSVWISHLRRPNSELIACLNAGSVLGHEMVIGELACGNLSDRAGFLSHLNAFPTAETLSSAELLLLIDTGGLMGTWHWVR